VLHEAAAAGLPVVATDVGGVRAALDNGRLGLVVPPRDAVAAVEALERLRTDYVLRRRLVDAGLAAARARTLDAEVDRVAEFFRSQLAAALPVTT
jgi:glycosyltransferase involved in cell wall biosynthesis